VVQNRNTQNPVNTIKGRSQSIKRLGYRCSLSRSIKERSFGEKLTSTEKKEWGELNNTNNLKKFRGQRLQDLKRIPFRGPGVEKEAETKRDETTGSYEKECKLGGS